jgi:predicted acyltransferase
LIFPFFLFIVGVAITLALGSKVDRGEKKSKIIPHILRRSATLFALGLFLSAFPFFKLATIRVPGVLQRIAVCYLCAAMIFLFTSARAQAIIAAALLAAYWMIMKLVPVPAAYVEEVIRSGQSAGVANLDLYVAQNANLAAYVDNHLLYGHMWSQTKTWDPEGILSTFPAIATALAGVLTGYLLRSNLDAIGKIKRLVTSGVALVACGYVMNIWFPFNKNLWTSSYVVLSAGMSLIFLALCYWIVDLKGYKRIGKPFVIYGMNAITVFVLSGVVGKTLGLIRETTTLADGTSVQRSLQAYYYETFFASWAGPMIGSLAYAIAFIVLMFLPVWWLYRHRIFIKV